MGYWGLGQLHVFSHNLYYVKSTGQIDQCNQDIFCIADRTDIFSRRSC